MCSRKNPQNKELCIILLDDFHALHIVSRQDLRANKIIAMKRKGNISINWKISYSTGCTTKIH